MTTTHTAFAFYQSAPNSKFNMQTSFTRFMPLYGSKQQTRDERRTAVENAIQEPFLYTLEEAPDDLPFATVDINVSGIAHVTDDEWFDDDFDIEETHVARGIWLATGFVFGVIACIVVALIAHKMKGLL